MAQYVYTLRRVGKVVPPKRQILKNISLNFFPGAKIGVLGLNGSGKSTLLRIMAGVETNFEGEVVPMPNMRIGFLPQEPQLDAAKTVREAVEEGLGCGSTTRLGPYDDRQTAASALDRVKQREKEQEAKDKEEEKKWGKKKGWF